MVQYDGEWVKVDQEWEYEPGATGGISIPIGTTYGELLSKLYLLMEVDSAQYNLVVKVKYKMGSKRNVPAFIRNDNDFTFFIQRNAMQPLDDTIPLCISTVSKVPAETDTSIVNEIQNFQSPIDEQIQTLVSQPTSTPMFSDTPRQLLQSYTLAPSPREAHSPLTHIVTAPTTVSNPAVVHDPILYLPPPNRPFQVGSLFDNKKVIIQKANEYAMSMKFRFKTPTSNTKLLVLKCSHGVCTWMLRAVKIHDSEMFEIRTYVDKHTCKLTERRGIGKQATASALADIFKNRYKDPDAEYRPKQIVDAVKRKYGIKLNYHQGWRTRESSIAKARGTLEESFAKLPSYLHMLEMKNEGTIQDIVTTDDGRFRYMFMALGSSIRGFKTSIRPVLCVDAAFLKHKVGGQMLVAVALDANDQLYPVAMGVVDTENNDSWNYFMSYLRLAIGLVPDLAFVSDRHISIANALSAHFPEAHHGACTFHLKMNINQRFKTRRCNFHFDRASEACTISEFSRHFEKIRSKHPRVADYLENDVKFERWSRAFFPGNRYDVLTSNAAESLNNRSRHARKYPITSLVEFFRNLLQTWFVERREEASNSDSSLAPAVDQRILGLFGESIHCDVCQLNDFEYIVTGGGADAKVDLNKWSCSCREFDLIGIPCKHALAVCHHRSFEVSEFCSRYYKNEAWVLAYHETIYPVLIGNEWDFEVPDEIKQRKCIIPLVKAKRGRRTEKRKPSRGELQKVRKRCSSCNSSGHNKSTCSEFTPDPSEKESVKRKKSKNIESSSSQN